MPPLREEATIAQAMLHQLAIQKDRPSARPRPPPPSSSGCRPTSPASTPTARETQMVAGRPGPGPPDADWPPWKRADRRRARAGPELAAAAKAAEDARAAAEAEVEQPGRPRRRRGRPGPRRRPARLEEAEGRMARTVRALDQAKAEREAVGPAPIPGRRRGPPALRQRRGGPRRPRRPRGPPRPNAPRPPAEAMVASWPAEARRPAGPPDAPRPAAWPS
jgi:chromosome segregation protein